jgi:hypothetical protein
MTDTSEGIPWVLAADDDSAIFDFDATRPEAAAVHL